MKKIEKLPTSVDFMLLGSCNLRCPFCFGPKHEMPPMETYLVKEIIHGLKKNGVKRIVFTGGEPTLIKDLPIILSEAKNYGLTTILSTNGLLLSSGGLLERTAPFLDWIALTLDGDRPKVNATMRIGLRPEDGIKHFEAFFKLVPIIRKKYPHLKIKLGTVVGLPNLKHIIGIPQLLSSQKVFPDTWKLYQVSPSEYAKINYSWLKIADEEFERIYKRAKQEALKFGIKNVVKYTNKKRPGKYLFINPRGEVLIVHPTTCDYYSIGNILSNLNGVLEKWRLYVNNQLLTKNFEETYPLILNSK